MYTRCPHCATIFRITAEQLRLAHGEVPCVTCTQPFNALESLSDDITTLIAAPVATAPTTPDTDVAGDDSEEDTEIQPIPDLSDIDPDHGAGDDGDDHSDDAIEPETPFYADEAKAADDEQPVESMEFDAPEQTWTRFFLTSDAIASLERANEASPLEAEPDSASPATEFAAADPVGQPWISGTEPGSFEFQTADQDEWRRFLAELDGNKSMPTAEDEDNNQITIDEPEPDEPDWSDAADSAPDEPLDDAFAAAEPRDEVNPSIILPWLDDETPDERAEQRRLYRPSRRALGACAALALLLAGQLIHYNRDALASHATYGATVRGIYDLFGAPLYPDWPLDAFEVSGTQAIAGRSNHNALDVLANVVVRGQQPVGLPLIRIVLRDRWTNPIASRVFEPREYLRAFDAENPFISPGTVLPVEISVADPGAEALSYVVDVCLPRRKTGLACQLAKDPFR